MFLDGANGARPFTAIDVVAHEFGHATQYRTVQAAWSAVLVSDAPCA